MVNCIKQFHVRPDLEAIQLQYNCDGINDLFKFITHCDIHTLVGTGHTLSMKDTYI